MASSISGGVHLGGNDDAPYLSLNLQIGTLPVIDLAIGPSSSLSLTGGVTYGLLSPTLSDALAGNILEAVLPPVLLGGINDSATPVIAGSNVLLGGTQINLPIGIANPLLFS